MLGLLILDFPSHRMLNKTEHKVATRGVKCGQMGLDSLHPRVVVRVVDEVQRYSGETYTERRNRCKTPVRSEESICCVQ